MYTLADDIKRYEAPRLLLKYVSRTTLTVLRQVFFITAITGFTIGLSGFVGLSEKYTSVGLGVGLISFALWLEQLMIYSYHNSFYFYGLNSVLGLSKHDVRGATYEVAEALLTNQSDVTKSFLTSKLGTEVVIRSGLDLNSLDTYLKSLRPKISTDTIALPPDSVFTLISLGQYLLRQDPSLEAFIQKSGVTKETFIDCLKWVVMTNHHEKKHQRWWGKDNLSKHGGIGRDWSYGESYILKKYSRDIRTSAIYSTLTNGDQAFAEEKINEVEISLAKAKAANVLVIGEAGVGKIDLLLEVDRRLRTGKALNAISHLHFVVLDTNRLFATHSNKTDLELTLINLFTEAVNSGNVAIVIENLSTFIREAEALGVFIPELLDPYLASTDLHVIATDTPGAYHNFLEPVGSFTRRFSEILIDTPNLSSTTRVLEQVAITTEQKFPVLFTYSALTAVTTAADRFIVEGNMPDKAIELLIDIATRATGSKVAIINQDYVYEVISEKTGIPAGPIKNEERDLLLNLEDKLHERVIGQEPAIAAIASTMRRARAGIQATDKPIGSFLFLGPTGVGKTETAKALAYVFFGSESNFTRFDMSEFSGEDSLNRMLGDGEESGLLPDQLREKPYCVLLLDEFEKAHRSIHDLFLQILDEGKFTDGRGESVNARNTIIIATSNAGSQLILKTVAQRQELITLETEIINHIIKEGIYRPELINRFDNTIIFEPLNIEEQGQVAGLMLKSLYERVREKGYELIITKDLIEVLVKKGYDPKFGARTMGRVIQDIVEEKIATLIISNKVNIGGTITLTKSDFTEKELST
jgi:ATP-dependent Clp protease ATP-binding subunit ClpC